MEIALIPLVLILPVNTNNLLNRKIGNNVTLETQFQQPEWKSSFSLLHMDDRKTNGKEKLLSFSMGYPSVDATWEEHKCGGCAIFKFHSLEQRFTLRGRKLHKDLDLVLILT